MSCITGSNHDMVLARLVTNIEERKILGHQLKKRRGKKRIQLDLEMLTEEDWKNFRTGLDKDLRGQEENKAIDKEDLDSMWEVFEKSLIRAVRKYLPRKEKRPAIETCNTEARDTEEVDIRKDIKALGKIQRKMKKQENKEKGRLTTEQRQVCIEIIERRELNKYDHIHTKDLL